MTVSIRTVGQSPVASLPPGFSGNVPTRALFQNERDPLHLYSHSLMRTAVLRAAPARIDCVVYVWRGQVCAGGRMLGAGSSAIVEHGAAIDFTGVDETSELLSFMAAREP